MQLKLFWFQQLVAIGGTDDKSCDTVLQKPSAIGAHSDVVMLTSLMSWH